MNFFFMQNDIEDIDKELDKKSAIKLCWERYKANLALM